MYRALPEGLPRRIAFRLTTRRIRIPRLSSSILAETISSIQSRGWVLRSASPRNFAAWSGHPEILVSERTVLLPTGWIGMTEQEMTALLQLQTRRLGLFATYESQSRANPLDSVWSGQVCLI